MNFIKNNLIGPQRLQKILNLITNLQFLNAEIALDLSSKQEAATVARVLNDVKSNLKECVFIIWSFDNFVTLKEELKDVFGVVNDTRKVGEASSIFFAQE